MSEQTKTLEELVREVPPEYEAELRDYVQSLVARRSIHPAVKPEFTWAGALENLRDRYTSVELQHRIASWRSDGE